jgi:hypothetical protein
MRAYTLQRLIWAGPLATAIAIVANYIYFLITKALGEPYLLPLDANGNQLTPMPAALPILGALFAGVLAVLFFGLLVRYARKPVTVFVSVAITALILSFGGPFGIPEAVLQTKLFLSGMNVLTALILVGGILIFSRDGWSRLPSSR